jgi:hypothetical protein
LNCQCLLLKPRLTGSEARHRLALSEGQKENKWKRIFPIKNGGKIKMTKYMKKAFLISTVIFSLLLATCVTSSVYASEETIEQKGLTTLNDVVGLDLAKYATISKEYPADSYLDVVPQENVRYNIESNGSKIEMFCTFIDGNLQRINVLENDGSPITTKAVTNTVDMAKDFLTEYQSYSGNAFYGDLASTLNDVVANKALTTVDGNTKLEVTASGSSSTFRWTYVYDGIEAPAKCVVLSYDAGFLKYFIDNWDLYKIGSTDINLSEKEAIDTGLTSAKDFSWMIGSGDNKYEVKDFNVTQAMVWETIFSNSPSADTARNQDPLTLYPMRHVWVSLDKFYFGNVYGIEVFLWADTKDVYDMKGRFSTLDPPAELMADFTPSSDQTPISTETNSIPITAIAVPILATITLGAVPFWLTKQKNCKKSKTLKFGILLCLMISSIMLLPSVVVVNAKEPKRGAYVWGSTSSGAKDTRLENATWRKKSTELAKQENTAEFIAGLFDDSGYNSSNFQGSGSLKADILSNITYSQGDYLTAVVDFDHGIGHEINGTWHHRFEDDNGTIIGNYTPNWTEVDPPANAVYDYEVYSNTGDSSDPSNVYFAFINTCMSADITMHGQGPIEENDTIVGMPYAWTHKNVSWINYPSFDIAHDMSLFGYSQPDGGNYVYLGFPWGSAALDQSVQAGYSSKTYAEWLEAFFYCALAFDLSVNDALDQASLTKFSMDFGETDLYTGFIAVWPYYNGTHWVDQEGENSTLAVYGNGELHLNGFSDNFNDNSMDTFRWQKLQANSATVNEANSRLEVTIPSGGDGQAQAGYVTTIPYDLHYATTSIEVWELNNMDEMILQICNTKVTSSDPFEEANWYRILKQRSSSSIYVQQRINGTLTTLINPTWLYPYGELKIEIDWAGNIKFYEDATLRYSTSFSLPSDNCYIYVFTSSPDWYYGTDVFDNFEVSCS